MRKQTERETESDIVVHDVVLQMHVFSHIDW